MYQGAYIDGFIQGVDATLTIDTGACDTIVSCGLFEKISNDCRPQLLEVHPRGDASGESLRSYGKAIMEIRMGSVCLTICVL